jgi:hypothetical protein
VIYIVNIINGEFVNLRLSAAILFGCCVVMDYSTYRSLQRRLHEQRQRKKMEEPAVSAFS